MDWLNRHAHKITAAAAAAAAAQHAHGTSKSPWHMHWQHHECRKRKHANKHITPACDAHCAMLAANTPCTTLTTSSRLEILIDERATPAIALNLLHMQGCAFCGVGLLLCHGPRPLAFQGRLPTLRAVRPACHP